MTPVRRRCDFVRAPATEGRRAAAIAALCAVLFASGFASAGQNKRPTRSRTSATRAGFSGDWDYSLTSYSFSLTLRQEGEKLTGYHSIVAGSGFMVDSVLPEHGKPSIRGSARGNRAVVTFRSGRDPKAAGKGELILKEGALLWRRLEGRGDHLFPVSQVLLPAQGFLEKARQFRRRRFPDEKPPAAPAGGAGAKANGGRGGR